MIHTTGDLRRDAALGRVASRHTAEIWRAQLSMLKAMRGRDDRAGTSDDATPENHEYGGNAPWVGAAVRQLAERRLITRVGTVRSARPSRKSNEVKLWRVADDARADSAIAALRRTLEACAPPLPEPIGSGLFSCLESKEKAGASTPAN